MSFPGPGPGPDLSLLKDDGGIVAGPGQVVVYVLGYTNEGTADASHGEDLDPADNQAIDETPLESGRVPDIPTLGVFGLILLGGCLGGLSLRRLRAG